MSYRYQIGKAANPVDLLNHIRIFAGNYGKTAYGTVASMNTAPAGGGYIADLDILSSALDETWTLVCTTPGGTGVAVFSVTGSTSGAQAAATDGTAYTVATKVTFKIKAFGLNWAVDDKIVITSVASATRTASADSWTVQRNGIAASDGRSAGADFGTYPGELILMGKDDGGAGGIYVGIQSTVTGADYYLNLNGMDSFSSGAAFDAQTGCHKQQGGTNNPITPLTNTVMGYTMTVTPRRIICRLLVNVSDEWLGLGLLTPYMTAGQMPYPLFVGGSSDESDKAFGSTGNVRAAFWNPGISSSSGSLLMRQMNGSWHRVSNHSSPSIYSAYGAQTYPYQNERMTLLRENLDGTVPLIPVCVLDRDNPSSGTDGWVVGEFDGLFATCGRVGDDITGATQTTGNTIGGTPPTHIIYQSAHRNTMANYCALKVS